MIHGLLEWTLIGLAEKRADLSSMYEPGHPILSLSQPGAAVDTTRPRKNVAIGTRPAHSQFQAFGITEYLRLPMRRDYDPT